MTLAHERYVAARFSEIAARFRDEVDADDYRLIACVEAISRHPVYPRGLRVLDLGCGKGRFARRLRELGVDVIGLDGSQGMLEHTVPVPCVRGSALRQPFASASFDAVIAVELFEHIPRSQIALAVAEARRTLRPGGVLTIIDKNAYALDAKRPWLPKVAVKRLDETRGRWMYPSDAPVREHWFAPRRFAQILKKSFVHVQIRHLLSPEESKRAVFQRVPHARLMVCWTASVGGCP